jgi:hypothetical protein
VDNDGDLDLFIGPGGNNNPPLSREMQNRLFLNDGKGDFIISYDAFPSNVNGVNTAVAVPYDFNKDGFMDLFVGGRSVPGQYGSAPSSFIFINDGKGHFKDIAPSKNPDIAKIGMVTSATMADINGDGEKDLIIVGEWMSPRIFTFKGDHFEEIKSSLNELDGLWQTVAVADINNDGKLDLILGNIGENFYLHPDKQNPAKLWINDFDENGITDKVITYTINGRDMPVVLKNDLQDQLPGIKKQNLKHEEYAKKSIQDLFPPEIMNKSIVKQFNYPSSCVALITVMESLLFKIFLHLHSSHV